LTIQKPERPFGADNFSRIVAGSGLRRRGCFFYWLGVRGAVMAESAARREQEQERQREWNKGRSSVVR
jgi:hypothetical protein